MCVVTVTVLGEGPPAHRELGLGVVLAGEGGQEGVAWWGEEKTTTCGAPQAQNIQHSLKIQQLKKKAM